MKPPRNAALLRKHPIMFTDGVYRVISYLADTHTPFWVLSVPSATALYVRAKFALRIDADRYARYHAEQTRSWSARP